MAQAIETLCSFAQSEELPVRERIRAVRALTLPPAFARAAAHLNGTSTAEARGPGARADVNRQGTAAGVTERT